MIFNDTRYEYYFIKALTNLRMMVLYFHGTVRSGGGEERAIDKGGNVRVA